MAAPPMPRVYCIPATAAPIVAVIRRGPARWTQIGRWDVERGLYEAGAWVRARIYEERCDVSPDGRWFAYFTLRGQPRPGWEAGATFIAISRLPWVKALAAWSTCGTWTRGVHFVNDRTVWALDDPDIGDAAPCRAKFGMQLTAPLAFASEHRRGWSETDDSPPRSARGAWDERVDGLTMRKPRPGAPQTEIRARGYYAAFRSTRMNEAFDFAYEVATNGEITTLTDVQWCDWDTRGRLLVATTDGRLQVRDGARSELAVVSEWTPTPSEPQPQPPPPEASRW